MHYCRYDRVILQKPSDIKEEKGILRRRKLNNACQPAYCLKTRQRRGVPTECELKRQHLSRIKAVKLNREDDDGENPVSVGTKHLTKLLFITFNDT